MHRWLLVGGLLALVGGCGPKSFKPSNGSNDASTGGGDSGGPCSCVVGSTTGTVTIACVSTECVDGTSIICTDVGTTLPGASCGPPTDAGTDGPGECVTTCTGKTCNVADNCGGICKCAAGVQCNPDDSCGNGCDLGVGEVCLPDAGSSTTCCGAGYACLTRDSGASACCAVFGGGHCGQDMDCCDYPVTHCSTSTGTCG